VKENKYFKNENASQLLKNTDQIQKHFLINNLVLYSFMVMFLYKGQPFKRAYHSSYITYLYHDFDRSPSPGNSMWKENRSGTTKLQVHPFCKARQRRTARAYTEHK